MNDSICSVLSVSYPGLSAITSKEVIETLFRSETYTAFPARSERKSNPWRLSIQ